MFSKKLAIILMIGISTGIFLSKSVKSEEVPRSNQDSFIDASAEKIWTQMKPLTFEGGRSGEGYFSRDGKKMIFQSERAPGNPFYQIYLMDLESGQTAKVSPGIGKTTCAWIHPSMKKVMYSSTHLDPMMKRKIEEELANRKAPQKKGYAWSYDENFDIFESNLSGGAVRRLTTEKGYDAEGNYSPDGRKIVFASNRAGYAEKLSEEESKLFHQDPSYMMDLYMMDADGKSVERLTTARGYDGGPFFSADGKFITWRRFSPNGQSAEIYTMDLTTREEKAVTSLKVMSWAPFFHPSGDYIVFTSNLLGYQNFELFIVDSLGKHKPVRVTHLEGFDGLPVFTPDGKKLSWTRRDSKGDSQIFIAQWDDQKARELLDLPAKISPESLSSEIQIPDLRAWVSYLASPEMKGRATGSPEEKVYTAKIAEYFKALGLKPAIGKSFVVPFSFTSDVKLGEQNKALLSDAKKSTELLLEKEFLPMSFSANGKIEKSGIVFAGYGIKAPAADKTEVYNSYKDLDVKGKWVLILQDTPEDLKLESKVHLVNYSRLQHKAFVAKNEGAIGLLVVSRVKEFNPKIRYEGANSDASLPVLQISQKLADTLLAATKKDFEDWKKELDGGDNSQLNTASATLDQVQLSAEIELVPIKSEGLNVLAILPGVNPQLTALGAHGDHLGAGQLGNSLAVGNEKGGIHAGADDNASGVASLLEVAGKISKEKSSLKNSVLFAVWSGEEIGLLGSHAFLKSFTENKSNPAIKSYLNMDMVGRSHEKLNVLGTGSASEWRRQLELLSPRTTLSLSIQDDPYVPSDGMEFYMKGIPMIMFFTGSHSEYHTPRDLPNLIDFPGLKNVTEFAYTSIKELAVKDPKLTLLKAESSQRKLEGRAFRTYLGTIPDYAQEGVKGVKISGSSKGSPAETAGLLTGDIIIELGGVKIENLYDYVYCLQAIKANVETTVKILRNGETKEFKITPKLKE